MKKTYTKKQIQEAISYWEKQLRAGNYRKVNESTDGDFAKIAAMMREMGIPEDKVQLQIDELKRAKAAGEFPGLTGRKARPARKGKTTVTLQGDEKYYGPSMGNYRMTLRKNGRVVDQYEWECFLFNQANADGIGDALRQFAAGDPDFAEVYDDALESDVGSMDESWTSDDGVFEVEITPETVSWEEFPPEWDSPMDSVELDDFQMRYVKQKAD